MAGGQELRPGRSQAVPEVTCELLQSWPWTPSSCLQTRSFPHKQESQPPPHPKQTRSVHHCAHTPGRGRASGKRYQEELSLLVCKKTDFSHGPGKERCSGCSEPSGSGRGPPHPYPRLHLDFLTLLLQDRGPDRPLSGRREVGRPDQPPLQWVAGGVPLLTGFCSPKRTSFNSSSPASQGHLVTTNSTETQGACLHPRKQMRSWSAHPGCPCSPVAADFPSLGEFGPALESPSGPHATSQLTKSRALGHYHRCGDRGPKAPKVQYSTPLPLANAEGVQPLPNSPPHRQFMRPQG